MRYLSITLLLSAACFAPLPARAQNTCTTSSLTGTYFYVLSGEYYSTTAGQFEPYAESGKVTADGTGGITGQSTASVGLAIGPLSLSGNYAVQANCTGMMTLNTEALNLQIISSGQSVLLTSSSMNFVISGEAYQAASTGTGQCGNGSLSGTYGYVVSGQIALTTGNYYYSESGQITADGNGHITDNNVYNIGGGGKADGGSGTYTINNDCTGAAQLVYPDGTFNYAIALAAGNNLLFLETDTGTGVAGVGQRPSAGVVLPQFVFGSGTWYSALYFTNSNRNSLSFTVNFITDGGSPLTVPSLGGSSVAVTIAPNGTAVLEAPNSGSFGEGYASVTLPAGVTGYGIFRQTVAGRPDQEAVVPFASASSTTNKLAWDQTGGAVTSVAIANPSSVGTNVTITVWDTSGSVLGTSPPIPISANGKTVGGLDNLVGLSLAGKRGSAQFAVSTGNVAVLGLRFSGVAFTSVPATGN
jgi:hypothetical protein